MEATLNQSVSQSVSRARSRFAALCGMAFAIVMMAAFSGSAWAEKVNLNSADVEALQYIPGIGPSKAKQIIAERTASDGFKTVDDLLAVPGIGEKTLEVIMQHGALDSGVSSLTDEMRQNPPSLSRNKASDAAATSDSG